MCVCVCVCGGGEFSITTKWRCKERWCMELLSAV